MVELDTIESRGVTICRLHHIPLVFDPDWAFILTAKYLGIGRASEHFPNAKWGHPATPEMADHELVGLWHCPACEVDRQMWLTATVPSW